MLPQFVDELTDRRLFRIAVTYLAAGWVGLQAMDQFTAQGVLPAFTYDLALVWFVTGIPITLVLGWYHGEKGAQHATKPEIAVLVLLLAGGIAGSTPIVTDEIDQQRRLEAATESQLDLRRVGVLYLEDHSPGDSLQYVADGFTEALIDELSAVRDLDVVSRNGVGRFRGSDLPRDSVARALDAGTLVEGSMERAGDRIRINVALVDGNSGAQIERAGFDRPADRLLEARAATVERTARLLREWLGEEIHLRDTRRETESVTAWALYHRAERRGERAEEALQNHETEAAFEAFERADSLAARAFIVDSTWADAPALRGHLGYRRARILAGGGDGRAAEEWIDRGLSHVERALDVEPNHARAIEVRGTLTYLRYLLGTVSDPEERRRLLAEAQENLRRAVRLDPTLASAHATLSHLYLQTHETTDMVLSARRAYEEDAYLDQAESVVTRLFSGNYTLQQFTEAGRWCQVGQRRFPGNPEFWSCEVLLMTAPDREPDPERAWELVSRIDSIASGHEGQWERLRAEIAAGGVLARAGMADSARSVWNRVRREATTEVDPTRWLRAVEAYMRTLVDDHDEALELLKEYVAVNPGANWSDNWWWRDLRSRREFQALAQQALHAGSSAH